MDTGRGKVDTLTGTLTADGNGLRRTTRRREWKYTAPLFVVAAFALGGLIGAHMIPPAFGGALGLLTAGCYVAVSSGA